LTKIKILESIVYVSYQLIFWGGREIAQEGGEILEKVSEKLKAKFWENIVSSRFQQNRNTTVQEARHTRLPSEILRLKCH